MDIPHIALMFVITAAVFLSLSYVGFMMDE